MNERDDETIIEDETESDQSQMPWHHRHFLQLLMGGMMLLLVLITVFQMIFPE